MKERLVWPTVVNIKHGRVDRNDPQVVYIGRAGHGQDGYFGNPVRRGQPCRLCGQIHQTNGETLPCYRRYFRRRLSTDPEFHRAVLNLAGKQLACFCHPGPCHGHVIRTWFAGGGRVDHRT